MFLWKREATTQPRRHTTAAGCSRQTHTHLHTIKELMAEKSNATQHQKCSGGTEEDRTKPKPQGNNSEVTADRRPTHRTKNRDRHPYTTTADRPDPQKHHHTRTHQRTHLPMMSFTKGMLLAMAHTIGNIFLRNVEQKQKGTLKGGGGAGELSRPSMVFTSSHCCHVCAFGAQKYNKSSRTALPLLSLAAPLLLSLSFSVSPEEVEEAENLDGQADDRVPREDKEETDRKNNRPP